MVLIFRVDHNCDLLIQNKLINYLRGQIYCGDLGSSHSVAYLKSQHIHYHLKKKLPKIDNIYVLWDIGEKCHPCLLWEMLSMSATHFPAMASCNNVVSYIYMILVLSTQNWPLCCVNRNNVVSYIYMVLMCPCKEHYK